ncbi:TPA: recombinase family protein [Pseudomonas aeruginosa]|uniref:recombinase family protein n=1 Tax=Pseudomonas aeruginosa TaxID=287 RepID=UPI00106CA4D1|nr:recombinase family protein [Pseudomonas aeruginosa]
MKIGYARVSTDDQSLDLQLDQLRESGCQTIFREKMTGKNNNRPVLAETLAQLREGDVLVVWKLDRLGRSLKHLINILQDLEARKIGFRCIADGIDTETPSGRLLFHVVGAIAEFEGALISERTKAGLQAARRKGKQIGRPPLVSAAQVKLARRLSDSGTWTNAAIAARLNVGKTTLWRAMKRDQGTV